MVTKIVVPVISVLVILAGAVWTAQGLNILPDGNPMRQSFMNGQPIWAAIGILLIIGGIYGITFALRPRRRL